MKTRTRAFRFKMSITYAGTFIVILRYVNFRPLYHAQAEFREAKYFPVDIFRIPNSLFDSVSDAESRDIKSLTRFPGNRILEILIKKYYCVGSTKMRGRFLLKMCPITFKTFRVGLFDFDWTYANFNPCKSYKTRDSVFQHHPIQYVQRRILQRIL